MITQEQLYEFVTTDSEDEAYELLLLFLAYFLSRYDDALAEASEKWNVEIPEPNTVRMDYAVYVTELIIGFRVRARDKALDLMRGDPDEFKETLEDYIEKDFARLDRTEQEVAEQTAQLQAADKAVELTDDTALYKTWRARPNCCAICDALDGTTIPVDEPFLVNGQIVELANGKTFIYKYKDRTIAIAHPNCRCWVEFSIRRK